MTLPARSLVPGRNRVRVLYAGDDAHESSTGTTTVTVRKAASKVSAVVAPKKAGPTGNAKVSITVTAADGTNPTGKVRIGVTGRTTTNAVRTGNVTVSLEKFRKPGRKTVTITYLGGRYVAKSTGSKHLPCRPGVAECRDQL